MSIPPIRTLSGNRIVETERRWLPPVRSDNSDRYAQFDRSVGIFLEEGRPPTHEGEIHLPSIMRIVRSFGFRVGRDGYLVIGETRPGVLRFHVLGESAPVTTRFAWQIARELSNWIRIDDRDAQCVEHDDCAISHELGHACWAARLR